MGRKNLEKELKEMILKFPLPQGWSFPELYWEKFQLDDWGLNLIGLSAVGPDGENIHGSAGDLQRIPLERAYFELLERISLLEFLGKPQETLCLRDWSGKIKGQKRWNEIFPTSRDPSRWVYSKSNGVALHLRPVEAASSAFLELMERDRILRSWFQQINPSIMNQDFQRERIPAAIEARYHISICLFGGLQMDMKMNMQLMGRGLENLFVMGVFGLPKLGEAPLVYGFGAGWDIQEAYEKASSECWQRLGFLWGENLPLGPLNFSPSPEFHQEYFLSPKGTDKIKKWLFRNRDAEGPSFAGTTGTIMNPQKMIWNKAQSEEVSFVDLTPTSLRGRISVLKSVMEGAIPLIFGEGYSTLNEFKETEKDLEIHPVL